LLEKLQSRKGFLVVARATVIAKCQQRAGHRGLYGMPGNFTEFIMVTKFIIPIAIHPMKKWATIFSCFARTQKFGNTTQSAD